MTSSPVDPVGVHATISTRVHYSPPWADVSIIGIAGSSGSGKSTLAHAIVRQLNLPWVVILSMDSYYKSLNAEQHKKAFASEYDFDSPEVCTWCLVRSWHGLRLKELSGTRFRYLGQDPL